ncbi:MAG: hypothetical protein V4754_18615 [Pseudomonadota bacterium]
MKILITVASLFALSMPAMAADVGVSINVGQPGFYGRIDIGDFPPPQVVYAQPVIIERPVRYVEQRPIYLRVPPGHAKHWSKHCRSYNACGQRVYFVQDNWYTNEYAPRYRSEHQHRGHGRGHQDREQRGGRDDRDDRHERHDEGRGHGRDKGDDRGRGH